MALSRSRRVPPQDGYYNSRAQFHGGPLVRTSNNAHDLSRKFQECLYGTLDIDSGPSLKRRKPSMAETSSLWEKDRRHQQQQQRQPGNVGNAMGRQDPSFYNGPSTSGSLSVPMGGESNSCNFTSYNPELQKVEDVVLPEDFQDTPDFFMSRDEIERCSPSRKDGIDSLKETHLRYSYCAFLQNLGMRLELPQTTIGTAMVLCHRFFVRRSHACHDRFLIATASLFLAAKSEETPRPLNTVLKASCEICHKHNLAFFPYLLPLDWFEKYRERVIEAEQMILTTLDFELSVQHPYIPLTTALNKLGLSQSVLVNLAWNLVSEGGLHNNSVFTCMIFLAGGLICSYGKCCFYHVKLQEFSSQVESTIVYGYVNHENPKPIAVGAWLHRLKLDPKSLIGPSPGPFLQSCFCIFLLF